jgi:formylmethanofuran dehydrogenase subunit A
VLPTHNNNINHFQELLDTLGYLKMTKKNKKRQAEEDGTENRGPFTTRRKRNSSVETKTSDVAKEAKVVAKEWNRTAKSLNDLGYKFYGKHLVQNSGTLTYS